MSDLADAVNKILAAAKSIDARKGKLVLLSDWQAIHSARAVIGSTDVGRLIVRSSPAAPPPAASDLQATAPPTGNTFSSAVGTVTFSCDPVADIHDGVTVGSGVANYTPNINGVDQTPITAPTANIIIAPTLYNIGTVTPTPTLVQVGRQFTLASAGQGPDSTTDQIAFAGWEITGDFDLYMQVGSFTGGGYDYARFGLMAREATAATVASTPTARYWSIFQWLGAALQGISAADRQTVAAQSSHNLGYASGDGTVKWLHLRKRRSGSTDTVSYDYGSGGTWTTLNTVTYTGWSNTLVIGAHCSDLQAVPNVLTGVATNLYYTTGAAISAPAFSTVSAASCKWKATDVAGNVSSYSPTVSGSPAATSYIKWNPSHGIGAAITDGGTSMTTAKATWDQARTRDVFGFGQLQTYWGKLETSAGVYDFSSIATARDYLNNTTIPGRFNVQKRLVLEIWWMAFGRTGIGDGTHPVPQYIIDNGWTKYDVPNSVWYADLTNSGCRTAFKAMITALAAAFDTDPWFELFCFSESALERQPYYEEIALHCKSVFAHTNVACGHNFLGTPLPNTDDKDFLVVCDANGIGTGGPDILVAPNETNGQYAHRGAGTVAISGWGTFDFGTTDHRGRIPNFLQRQVIWGPTDDALATYAAAQKATHVSWWVDSSSPVAHDITSTTTAATNHPVYTTCPTSYGGICAVG